VNRGLVYDASCPASQPVQAGVESVRWRLQLQKQQAPQLNKNVPDPYFPGVPRTDGEKRDNILSNLSEISAVSVAAEKFRLWCYHGITYDKSC
jgi:hypothetical protein